MTINLSDNNPRANYTATSGQTAFTIPFDYFDDGDISVYQNGTLKTITTHYTISGSTMTLVTGATAGDKIAITRDVPLERTTDLTSTYSASSINNQLDTIVAQIADLDDRVSRSISLNDYEVGVSLDLPATADRLGKTIQFNSSTGALEVGPSGDELTSIASIADEITALDGISSNITTVAGAISNVNNVGGSISSVNTVASSISNINTVNTNIANVNLVGASIADVNDVADSLDQVDLVATSISNVDIVGPAISNVNTVAGDISNINTLANSTSNIALVAAALSNINTTVTNLSNINLVGNNIDDVNDVANVITKVTTVADNISNVNTVAPSVQYLSDVANNISTISTVGQNISDIQGAVTAAANAATSESNAATSETNAATSAGNAATSESNAATSASSASSAQASAESARDATLAAFDSFDDRYLGAKTADPSLDNDGNALVGGALYYNSVDEVMKVYTGSAWVAAYASLSGALLVSNNLSDLNNAASARANLGLGSAATTASTDYATAAQGTLADNALPTSGGTMTGALVLNADPTAALGASTKQYVDTQIATKVSKSGDTMTGNLSFGDNDKAIFGSSNPLEIYHDGSNKYIQDTGGGSLFIRGSDLVLEDDGGNDYITMSDTGTGGTVTLKHNASAKLTTESGGVNITGTLTSDGLTVDGTAAFNLGSGEEVSVYRSTDYAVLRLGASSTDHWSFQEAGTNSLFLGSTDSGTAVNHVKLDNNGDISFYEDTGTTPKFFWDASAESLGIGTSSPMVALNVHDSTNARIALTNSSTGQTFPDGFELLATGLDAYVQNRSNGNMIFTTNNSERMRIDSSGNVGIGTSSPIEKITANGAVVSTASNSTGSTSGANRAILDFTSGGARIGHFRGTTAAGSGYASFYTDSAERMRIDSSGNLLVGTTGVDPHNASQDAGVALRSDGRVLVGVDGDIAAAFNRNNSDGNIALFKKDGSTVGSIGVAGGDLYISGGSSHAGIRFDTNLLTPAVNGTQTDATVNLGYSSYRYKDAHFSGTVNAGNFNTTSDATLKTNVETLTGSLDAVKAMRGVSYDWIENGNSEVGVIAQEVEEVIPDVVSTNDQGIKSVKYGNLVGVLIEAIKEQQAQIDELKARLGD